MNKQRKIVMIVDDNAANLTIAKNILKHRYRVYTIPSAEVLFDLLGYVRPDMILLDVEMPDIDGYEAIKRLKNSPGLADIPVVFLTQRIDNVSELHGLTLGAVDYVTKPFSAPLLLKRIENHIEADERRKLLSKINGSLAERVRHETNRVLKLQGAVLSCIADMVEFRDSETGGHVNRTQAYLKLLLDKMMEKGVYKDETAGWDMSYLLPSAQLHDVGKIAISDTILNKPSKLDEEEFRIMKTHVELGLRLIKRIQLNTDEHSFLKHAALFAGEHHEKWDGSGYPAGLAESGISLEGRMMAVADVYDALVSKRPYKPPYSADEARDIIIKGSGTHFDPTLVDIFRDVSGQFARALKNGTQPENQGAPYF
jgi:putative two-component system response regulator